MDKVIGILLVISAIVTIMLSFFDSTRVFVG
jgi:sugar phosphate permease